MCVEDLVEKQNKTTLFKVTEPSSVPYRTPPACAKMAAYHVTVSVAEDKKDSIFYQKPEWTSQAEHKAYFQFRVDEGIFMQLVAKCCVGMPDISYSVLDTSM